MGNVTSDECKSNMADNRSVVFPGADEATPSLAQYFSWINNTNEGATEKQTLANLAFFEWLHDEYGMKLDIYAFDAGAIDGCGFYGSDRSERFKRQFPNGFAPMVKAAARFDCRLGIWGGPDGFGNTEEEARARIEMMVSLCRDHHFMLFKFDSVCGGLRPDKVSNFVQMMAECRKYAPDLILLNHRLELGEGLPHATTFLWEGQEMYSDVNITNHLPGIHSRVGELGRGLPPQLKRLTEDHGVCLSSCLDYWEDSLILQAFNRCLILAPEIYGNPWLLRDDEFPRLARIYNLHRRYRDILVNGRVLAEVPYGKDAVSRGDSETRFLTFRNLGWERVTIPVTLDERVGLEARGRVEVRRLHPYETVLGDFAWGETVDVVVEPFRACLVMASSKAISEIGFRGCEGEIVKDKPGEDAELRLLGLPGTEVTVRIEARGYGNARLDGVSADALLSEGGMKIRFSGDTPKAHWHRKLGLLKAIEVPADAEAFHESCCFSSDSNALEVRELRRAGLSRFPAVENARAAFFTQETFRQRGLWDRNLFDNDPESFFGVCRRYRDIRVRGGAFRLDFGEAVAIDRLILETKDDYNMQPIRNHEAVSGWVSVDLRTWMPVKGFADGDIQFPIDVNFPVRYFRMDKAPDRINEVRGFYQGTALIRTDWRASNLFAPTFGATAAWQAMIRVDEVYEGSYLVVPVFGPHVPESVCAAARCGERYLGAARRATSYMSNVFEQRVSPGRSYSFFIPLDKAVEGKLIDVYLIGRSDCAKEAISGEVWLTAYPPPYLARRVVLGGTSGYVDCTRIR